MDLKSPLFSLKLSPQTLKFHHNHPFPSLTLPNNNQWKNTKISNKISDSDLVAELAAEKAKLKTNSIEREEAMKKSRDILFQELCQYLDLEADQVKQKWRKMDEEEKIGWAKRFVSEWGESFHPLSSKSVKEMVDEKLLGEDKTPSSSLSSPTSSFNIFLNLKRIIGFTQQPKQN